MEDLTELLKQRENLESQISNTKNAKVLAEIAEIDKQVLDLQQQKLDAEEHRKASDQKLLEEMKFCDEEKSRLKNLYFGNTYKIQELQNQIIHLSNLRREVKERLSTIKG
jgi:chromosome segregation ATPase